MPEDLKSDHEIGLKAVKKKYSSIVFCSQFLRNEEDFICEAYKIDHNNMRYFEEEIINKYQIIKDLYDEYKSLVVKEDNDDFQY